MTLIAGRYQPLEAPRAGVALRARDLQTAQSVVLREVAMTVDKAADALVRAHAARGIFHPSLITLFDAVALEETRLLLAYEYVPAHTVAQLAGGQPFNIKRAAAIVSEIADAAAELHARDVVHGSISPDTVLITMKGKAKLDRVGEPTTTSPPPTVNTDVHALGSLLEELVGTLPGGVPGSQAVEVIVARAKGGKFASAATLAAMLRRI